MQIAEALTTIGLEVESVEEQGKALKPFVVARWSRPSRIPIRTTSRSARSMPAPATLIDVVCGAPNAVTGMKSVFAFPGTYIPGKDFELKDGVVIRGAEEQRHALLGRRTRAQQRP